MYKRYQGNSGRVTRVDEEAHRPVPPEQRPSPSPRPPRRQGLPELLGGLLPGGQDWDTEDLILLLILYLMYRESGDSDLLVILGAMFLL